MNIQLNKEKLHIFFDIFRTLRWALSVLEEYKLWVCIHITILILHAGYEIFLTSRIGNIVDLALLDDIHKLLRSGITLICFYIIYIAISLIGNRLAARNFNGMYNSLELQVYRKIMDSSWEELTDYHSGDLITRLSSDIKILAGNTSGLVPTMILKLTVIVFAGIYIIILDYSMVLIAVVVAPIVLFSSRVFMGKIFASQMKIKNIESRINSYNKETFNNIQAIKAFNLGDIFYSKMEIFENDRKNADLRSNTYSLLAWAISFFCGIAGMSVCIGWMFYRVHQGLISFGSLSVLAFLMVQVGTALKSLLDLIPVMMEYMASAERVKKILTLSDEEEIIPSTDIESFSKSAFENGVSVKVEDMYFKYKNGYAVFEGASIEANPGEIVALVGPSGEGKTTMLRILLGIVTAYKGSVLAVSGSESLQLGKQTRQLISYVPQGNTMMEGTIMENMMIVDQQATRDSISEALKTACIHDFVEQLPDRLDHKLGESGLGFSEGQNQRLSVARAILKNAPILLLDEATSALDVATERKVLNNIIKKDPQKTILLTTHRPTVLSMCDRVYRIANKTVSVIGQEDIKKLMDEF